MTGLRRPFVLLLTAFVPFCPSVSASWVKADLTEAEKEYVRKVDTVKMCVDPDWEPFEKIDSEGKYVGIGADLVRTVFERVGLKLEILKTADWDESVAASKAWKCRWLAFLNQTAARDEWLSFTNPVFLDPNVVITREGHPFIGDLSELQNESVAIPHNTSIEEWLRKEYPNLLVIPTKSESEAIDMVSERRADMTVRSLVIAAYTIRKQGLFNLKVSGEFSWHENHLRIGVSKDDSELLAVLQKGVATITEADRQAATNRHVPMTIQKGTDYSVVVKILLGVALLLAVWLYWNRKLSALNRELERLSATDKLTGLSNRVKLDSKLDEETGRSERFWSPFSVIIADIDFFKAVNDAHGHQAGDAVLVRTASILRENTRKTDVVWRWGGEEFLILCPHTDEEWAVMLAENLRKGMENADFGKVGKRTASFGVAEFRPGQTVEHLVANADAALYRAKRAGRNLVMV